MALQHYETIVSFRCKSA